MIELSLPHDEKTRASVSTLRPFMVVTQIEIHTVYGPKLVPALTHPILPGVAVAMATFGTFNLTHIPTGRKMIGGHQRFGASVLQFAQVAAISRAYNLDWSITQPDLAREMERIGHEPVPFEGATRTGKDGTVPMTVLEYFRFAKSSIPSIDEFPWESPDEDPCEIGLALMESLGAEPAGAERDA